jgi:hypothetical protein
MEFQFQEKHLLTFDEVEQLIISPFPNEKAKIIASKLLNYLLIHNDEFYRYDYDNILYIKENNNDNYVLTIITSFIQESYGKLERIAQENLQFKYKKSFDKIFSNADVGKYLPQLITHLTNNKIDFSDPQIMQIHFKNGYYDFESGTFKKRVHAKHFINIFINRNYAEPLKEEKENMLKTVKQIYPNDADRHYLLMILGIAITGMACSEQTMLFLLGLGSSGKSTIMELCKLALNEDYVFCLPKETFTKGFSKIDKTMNTYLTKRCIRISHINEPEDTKINESLFKDHCDGKIQTTSLYKDGANDFRHCSKMVFTSNTFPNIKIDSGSIRRVDSYTHQSKFTKDKSIVDESKHIYLRDDNLLSNIAKCDKSKNAFFSILAEYGYNWLTKKAVYEQTENFRTTKDTVISSNDIIQDFIDMCLTSTGKDCDRIGKDEMYELFKLHFPRSYMTPIQLLSSLKQKEIQYNSDYRHKKTNTRGCYVGLLIKSKHETLPISIFDPTDNGIDKTDMSVDIIKMHKKQIEDMQKEYESQIKRMQEEHKRELDLLRMQLTCKELTQTTQELNKIANILTEKTHIKNEKKKQPQTKKEKHVFQTLVERLEKNAVFEDTETHHRKKFDELKQRKLESVDNFNTTCTTDIEVNESFTDMANGLLDF